MPFEKGQSGNPSGRPKEDPELKRMAREHTEEAITTLVQWMRSDNAKASVGACNALLDRGYGKPKQALVGGDDDDKPLKVLSEVLLRGVNATGD